MSFETEAAKEKMTLKIPFEVKKTEEGHKMISADATFCETYWACIFCGLREGYNGTLFAIEEVFDILQVMMKEEPFGAMVTPTFYVYPGAVNDAEEGVNVQLFDYPRFPRGKEWIDIKARQIAYKLMTELKQNRVSIMSPGYSVMLENPKTFQIKDSV